MRDVKGRMNFYRQCLNYRCYCKAEVVIWTLSLGFGSKFLSHGEKFAIFSLTGVYSTKPNIRKLARRPDLVWLFCLAIHITKAIILFFPPHLLSVVKVREKSEFQSCPNASSPPSRSVSKADTMLLRQINALACTVLNLTRENINFARLTCYERFYLRDRSLLFPGGVGVRGFWLCHIKIYLIPLRPCNIFLWSPCNSQSIFYRSPHYILLANDWSPSLPSWKPSDIPKKILLPPGHNKGLFLSLSQILWTLNGDLALDLAWIITIFSLETD